jgi:N utilization substance protein B
MDRKNERMSRRSRAREVVLQLLYQFDQNRQAVGEQETKFLARRLRDPELEAFAAQLYQGTLDRRKEIDERLAQVAENWSVERMAAVDRNILRLGAYELLFASDTPPKVAMDEAIELAKRFGSADSPAFVNGILDKLASLRKPAPSTEP